MSTASAKGGGGFGDCLADGAKVGRSTGEDRTIELNLGSTASARESASAVDAMLHLEVAGRAGRVDIVSNRRSSPKDRAFENPTNGPGESLNFLAGRSDSDGGGVQASVKEDLVGVDVAHAGQNPLIEQDGLESATTLGEDAREVSTGDEDGVGAKVIRSKAVGEFVRFEKKDFAKTARILEPEFVSAAIDRQGQMRVRSSPGRGGFDRESAGHAEVKREGTSVVESREDPLADAVDPLNATTADFVREGARNTASHQTRVERARGQRATHQYRS
jgi:hypothetical protein